MKKTIYLIAAACCLLLAGCGAGDAKNTPDETPIRPDACTRPG